LGLLLPRMSRGLLTSEYKCRAKKLHYERNIFILEH
jgi:hypothetical protein